MVVLLFLSTVVHAACETPGTPTEVLSESNTALSAFAALDEAGFNASADRIDALVDCLGLSLSPGVAAAVHRVHGLRSFLEGDDPGTTSHFTAARRVQGAVVLPDSVAPSGGPVDGLWQQSDPSSATATAAVEVPSSAKVWVDGTATRDRPTAVPSIVQVGRSGSDIVWSGLTGPGWSGVPSSVSSQFTDVPPPVASTSSSRGGGGNPWWAVTIASGATAAALFGTAIATNVAYDGSQGMLTLNQASYWGSIGAGTATLAFGGVALGTN